jgi:3-(3-hydroxy-phenyl)propionate hydroxylase
MSSYAYLTYPAAPRPSGPPRRHKVVIIGAGPVGLAAAIDLAQHGIEVVLLDEDNTVSEGSRAICWAKRTLEIFDRLGVAAPMMAKGVTWNTGKVFQKDRLVYAFDLQPEGDHQFPAFINLQQYYAEAILVERAMALPAIKLRWKHRMVGLAQGSDGVTLSVETPDGGYMLGADYVLAADGARSTVRKLLGLEFKGKVFEDRFLIADVRMEAEFPAERWFWFDPPFHPGQSALLHRQADNIWRIDLQLGWNADPEEEKKPERVIPRLKAMLGATRDFTLEWVSVYTFQCRRLDRFRHGRVIFVGDSAHQVSPFGARGGNGGIQDVDNLAWKLAMVLDGTAPEMLLDSYDAERAVAADENIRHSTRATDFITPKGAASQTYRDAVLALAQTHPFARALVNSGRLSRPAVLSSSPLGTPDADDFAGAMTPGAPCADAPVVDDAGGADWLLRRFRGDAFAAFYFAGDGAVPDAVGEACRALSLPCIAIGEKAGAGRLGDPKRLVAQRYDLRPGSVYLIRPDQHVAARWRRFDAERLATARRRATFGA